MAAAALTEVRAFHGFLVAWFTGAAEPGALTPRLARFDPAFRYITPDGADRALDELRTDLAGAHGRRPDMRIRIEALSVRWQRADAALVTYEEHQSRGGGASARLSSALFVAGGGAPARWYHLHEVWLA